MVQTPPRNRKYFEDLVELARDNEVFNKRTLQALTWHKNKVKEKFGSKDILPDAFFDKKNYPNKPIPGNIVTFRYAPKLKNTLQYYDEFPLVLIVKLVPGGFLGLNFHYLHPIDRATYMSKLAKYEKPFSDGTIKINITRYSALKTVCNIPFHKECIKAYKTSNIKTMFYTLTPEEWDIALFLPTEKFIKKKKQDVWKESTQRVRKK